MNSDNVFIKKIVQESHHIPYVIPMLYSWKIVQESHHIPYVKLILTNLTQWSYFDILKVNYQPLLATKEVETNPQSFWNIIIFSVTWCFAMLLTVAIATCGLL